MVSSELPELINISSRIAVMHEGNSIRFLNMKSLQSTMRTLYKKRLCSMRPGEGMIVAKKKNVLKSMFNGVGGAFFALVVMVVALCVFTDTSPPA